jgi:phosphonate transport system substrate-binding protein
LGIFALLALIVSACTSPGASPTDAEPDATESQAAETPDELIIGFVPSREADALVETIQPVADALSEALGIPVTGIVSTDYTALVEAMNTGQAQIGALGPFSLLQARDRAGAEIILQSERFGSATYHTQFMTNNPDKYCEDEPVENTRMSDDQELTFLNCNGTDRAFDESPEGPVGIEALESVEPGTEVSFTAQDSASGYIFPATVFATMGLNPETDLAPVFSETHDNSVVTVCEGGAEVGVSFDDARTEPVTDCDVASNVVVFAYGPEIPNDGVGVAGDLPDDLKQQIRDALLAYAETEEGQTVLDEVYNISAFADPNLDSLEIVRQAVEELGYEG